MTKNLSEIKQKAARFCAYQERCISDIKRKLKTLNATDEETNTIIGELINEGFLNEERFSRLFGSGKFRIKGWGRMKIYKALQEKGIKGPDIRKAIDEIDEEEYLQKLKSIMKKKEKELTDEDFTKRKQKLVNFATGRGFESGLIWEVMKEINYK